MRRRAPAQVHMSVVPFALSLHDSLFGAKSPISVEWPEFLHLSTLQSPVNA